MKASKKRGFTIIELVIVIAVIAILAAVLIPTFTSLIKKANESADIQAVRQMNTYLGINEVTAGKTILDVYNALIDGGMSAKDYHPLVSDRYFFWDKTLNRIVYTDENYNVLFPENSGSVTTNGWYSLSQEIKDVEYSITNNVVDITEAGQLAKLAKEYKGKEALTINVKNDIDMMGASFHIEGNDIQLIGNGSGVKIIGLVNANYQEMTKNNAGTPTAYNNSLIKCQAGAKKDASVTIKNITFESVSLGMEKSSDVALVSMLGFETDNVSESPIVNNNGSITFENVHIVNSEFVGKYRVAGFIAHTDAKNVTMTNFSIKNSTLKASVGAVAPIFSMLNNKGTFTNVVSENNTVICSNPDYEKLTSLTVNGYEVKLPADGIMTKEPQSSGYRWYPAKSAFGIYGTTISYGGGIVADDKYPLASGGLDCVETLEVANNYTFNSNRIS